MKATRELPPSHTARIGMLFRSLVCPEFNPEPTPEQLAEEYQRNFEALERGLNKEFRFPY
jgi:hypothetical protein